MAVDSHALFSRRDGASRRRFLAAGGSLLAALGLGPGLSSPTLAAKRRLVVADPGGPFREAFGQAFYRPFERETGTEIRDLARKHLLRDEAGSSC